MNKKVLNIIEISLIIFIIIICLSCLFKENNLYSKINISNYRLEEVTNHDILLVNNSNNTTHKLLIISLLNNIASNKKLTILFLIIPFCILILLEVLNIIKENKRKVMENKISIELEKFNDISKKDDLSIAIEKNIVDKLNDIKDSKRDYKKITNLENTIQISLEEIQSQIDLLTEKKEEKENKDLEKTVAIINESNNLQEEIKKELEIRNKLSTKSIDKKKTKNKKVNN